MGLVRDFLPALKYGNKILESEIQGGVNVFSDVWYVDGDNGSDSDTGVDPEHAFATIQAGIDAASSQDTVYIRTLAPDADASEPGTYEEDLSIPYAKHGLSLIGVGATNGLQPFGGPKVKNATATTLLDVKASNVYIKGLQFNCTRNSGTYGIRLQGIAGYATLAGSVGTVIEDCYFKNASATYGGIYVYGGYEVRISRCTFHLGTNALGVIFHSTPVPNNGHLIEYSNFKSNNGVVVTLYLDLASSKDIMVDHCNFDQATTFITCVDGAEGLISNCCFNDGSTTTVANSSGKIEIPAANDELSLTGCYGGGGALIACSGD